MLEKKLKAVKKIVKKEKAKSDKEVKKNKWPIALLVIFFVLLLPILFFLFYQGIYSNKIYAGVKLGEFSVGGKTKEDLQVFLKDTIEQFSQDGFVFQTFYNGQTKKIIIQPIVVSPADPDLSREVINFKVKEMVDDYYQIGRNGGLFSRLKERASALLKGKKVDFKVEIDKNELVNILESNFHSLEQPPEDAKLMIDENSQISVVLEREGIIFDYDKSISDLENNLKSFKNRPIDLRLVTRQPEIKEVATRELYPKIEEIIQIPFITLTYQDKEWKIKKEQIHEWLEFKKIENNNIGLGFNKERLTAYLDDIGKEINQEAKEPKFQMTDSRVSEFQAPEEGILLDVEKTRQKIEEEAIDSNNTKIEIKVEKRSPSTILGDLNNLGIKELIGTGRSDFSGSPQNRRHNIGVGAASLNGILIKPNEEFSLIKALGNVDASTGYLPELVIKGDRTVPEFGGGLCQIGTTTFRAALNAGLAVTERQPHSYRVVYYEPAGMDATIYNPQPDLKFINDTGGYILWQSKIEGNNLIFEFWGTKDGRNVEVTTPKIFNVTSPGPTRIIETVDLKEGEKKCIEMAHKGADAEFTRIITHSDGTKKEEVWKSHYKPWPEVCLVGKAPESAIVPIAPVENIDVSPKLPGE